jgi:hypothetical protein
MVRQSDLHLLDKALTDDSSVEIINNATGTNFNLSNTTQIFTIGNGKVRAAYGNKFTLTIQEQSGCTLLSVIRAAADKLGIGSHIHARYIMVVEFNGRMRDGKIKKYSQKFYYPLSIVQFDFKVTDGGTTYNVDAIENSTNAYSYLSNVIKDQITIEAQTVGEFVDKFETAVNDAAYRIWETNPSAIYIDKFEFSFDEDTEAWRSWRFQQLDETNATGGFNIVGTGNGNDALQININNGSNITDLIGTVLQLTAEYKNVIRSDTGKSFKETPSDDSTESLSAFPVFYKMIANVEYGEFDILRGEYSKIIKYKLKKFIITDEIVDSMAYSRSIGDDSIQKARISNMRKLKLLRKRYDYIFTGRNTEVLDLDLTFNNAYYYLVPHGGGLLGDADSQTPQNYNDVQNVIERIVSKKEAISKLMRDRQALVSKRTNTASEKPDRIEYEISEINRILNGKLDTFRDTIQTDIDVLKEEYGLTSEGISHQIRFATDVLNDADTVGSDNDRKGGAYKFGALKANTENVADLINIELSIKGDPYWLGLPNSLASSANRDIDALADYEVGSQNFFLKVNLPTNNEDSRGSKKPQLDYQISGIYAVVTVINVFSDGQFIQYLEAVRDLGTNIAKVADVLDINDDNDRSTSSANRSSTEIDPAQTQEDADRQIRGNA